MAAQLGAGHGQLVDRQLLHLDSPTEIAVFKRAWASAAPLELTSAGIVWRSLCEMIVNDRVTSARVGIVTDYW